ncbi:hypothetical protein LLG96_07470, partial [bacterium]|nr:hypothetical protein [bacterium]
RIHRSGVWLGYRSTDDTIDGSKRQNYRLGFDYRPAGISDMQVRSLYAWSDSDGEHGPFWETTFLMQRSGFGFEIAGGIFDIPSYDARFYRYEYDVPGRGYTRPVWGRGGTVTAVVRWKQVSCRYRYGDSDLMDTAHEITVQLDTVF